MRLTEKERIEILIMLGTGDKTRTQQQVCNLFNNKYPNREPISQGTVSKIEKKWRNIGIVKDIRRSGRPRVSDEKKLDILLTVQENPHTSSTHMATDNNLHQSTVSKILKQQKLHPYKVQFIQELLDDDPDRRNEFCENMIDLINDNARLLRMICFSDEATFCLNGEVNKQNFRYWATENPHWYMETHTQYRGNVNVWAGIVDNRVIGPFFFEGTLTGQRYLEFLQNDLIPALATLYPNGNDPDLPNEELWFQQDGAPPHYAADVRRYLNDTFPGRWIGRRGPIEWPARSPDLNPLDFFLWGHVKNVVYKNRPNNIEDLKNEIRLAFRNISQQTIINVQREFFDRLGYCRAVNGGHFQHLIK